MRKVFGILAVAGLVVSAPVRRRLRASTRGSARRASVSSRSGITVRAIVNASSSAAWCARSGRAPCAAR